MAGNDCRQICDPKRDSRFSWSERGSKYCKRCDVLITVEINRCPCCRVLLKTHLRDYIKRYDRR